MRKPNVQSTRLYIIRNKGNNSQIMAEWSTIPVQDNSQYPALKMCSPWTWRLANCVMALFFALAAYVQINDPDPVIWVLIYGIPCLLCVALVVNSSLQDHFLWKLTAATHLGACIFGVLYLLSVLFRTETTSKNPLNYEEGREIAGLLIIVFWLALCQVTRRKSSGGTTSYLWTVTTAISVIPFVLWGYFLATWDMSSLQSHCKDIITRHLYKQEI